MDAHVGKVNYYSTVTCSFCIFSCYKENNEVEIKKES